SLCVPPLGRTRSSLARGSSAQGAGESRGPSSRGALADSRPLATVVRPPGEDGSSVHIASGRRASGSSAPSVFLCVPAFAPDLTMRSQAQGGFHVHRAAEPDPPFPVSSLHASTLYRLIAFDRTRHPRRLREP